MTDVWKIGQDVKADEFYNGSKKGNLYYVDGEGENAQTKSGRIMFLGGEIFAANRLTEICNEMTKTYDKIITDQNDYLIDIDASLDELSVLKNDLEAQIKKLEAEVEKLLIKKENGTITPEEEAELNSKSNELNNLRTQADSQINNKNNEITKTVKQSGTEDRKAKAKIATNYGETALEKGQPLSETKDKRKSFWRKLAGSWNKSAEREAGKKLLDAGNDLLEQVQLSSNLDSEINKKIK